MNRHSAFEVRVERGEDWARVVPCGELDLATAPQLEREVQAALSGVEAIVLDLSQLTFIDSSGLRVLIVLHQQSEADGWRLCLVNPAKATQTIFRISGVDKHLPFAEE